MGARTHCRRPLMAAGHAATNLDKHAADTPRWRNGTARRAVSQSETGRTALQNSTSGTFKQKPTQHTDTQRTAQSRPRRRNILQKLPPESCLGAAPKHLRPTAISHPPVCIGHRPASRDAGREATISTKGETGMTSPNTRLHSTWQPAQSSPAPIIMGRSC